jgi:hypothetical protein
MRGQLISKASALLGVPAADFENLVPKTFRARPMPEDRTVRTADPAPRHDLAMLGLLALRNEEARDFLLTQEWRDVLAETPDAQLLVQILQGDFRPDDPASLNTFMSSLSPESEALVSSWMMKRRPATPSR